MHLKRNMHKSSMYNFSKVFTSSAGFGSYSSLEKLQLWGLIMNLEKCPQSSLSDILDIDQYVWLSLGVKGNTF